VTLRCAAAAEARGDQLFGTASPVARWLLVEQPGPWGRTAIIESRLDPVVAAHLSRQTRAIGVRVLVIRRPGRRDPVTVRQWAYVDARPGSENAWWGTFDNDEQLLDLPLDGSAGTSSAAPVYLVCTHGRHDVCCALRGRPIAAALSALRPGATWECSHVGGDRFAGNLVVLPHGLYYGFLDPARAIDVVAAYEQGRVVPTWLRGRAAFPGAVQAAQAFARAALSIQGVDALNPLDWSEHDGIWDVSLQGLRDVVRVTVRATFAREGHLLTDAAVRPERPRVFELVSIDGARP
jgi:Sucrase/ferredoxin-like